jgi:hypothetical protein
MVTLHQSLGSLLLAAELETLGAYKKKRSPLGMGLKDLGPANV